MDFKTSGMKLAFGALACTALGFGISRFDQSPATETTRNVCTGPILLPSTAEEYKTAKLIAAAHYDENVETTHMRLLVKDVTERLNRGEKVTVQLQPPSNTATVTLMDGSKRQSPCYTIS